tara:strand:- start:23362 stop:24138 length:777 start_codon:yes stop_codon:yes gene_type:complete
MFGSMLLSNLKYLYYSNFIKYTKPAKIENICIFCKGESLDLFFDYVKNKKNKIDVIILVNFEDNDLLSKKNLKSVIEGIPIIFIGNIVEPLLNLDNLKGLSLYEVYIQRFKPDKFQIKKTSLAGNRTNYRLNSISKNVKYLNLYTLNFFTNLRLKFKDGLRSNCGLTSIILACSYNPKTINIFGLDFYETEYYNFDLLDKMNLKEKKMLALYKKDFKIFFKHIVSEHSKIQINAYTFASLDKSFKHIKNLNIQSINIK